ncbi:MAG: hydroxyphenylacetyl-CoA thioesterase PaaI [Chloroflexi bacterium]|nr:hydroxyphenylacetyl-CoA thioesterase PaaI [Chloroflexota bacterium]
MKDDARNGEPSVLTLAQIQERVSRDPFANSLGIELLELREGYSRAALTVGENMLNFHGLPHGGAIFSLADAAFGAACNAHGQVSVALNVTIHFLAAMPAGTRLYAEATEESRTRRIGLYRMAVTTEDGALVALCHGTAYCRDELLTAA